MVIESDNHSESDAKTELESLAGEDLGVMISSCGHAAGCPCDNACSANVGAGCAQLGSAAHHDGGGGGISGVTPAWMGGRRQCLNDRVWPAPLAALVREPKRTALLWGGFNFVFIGIGELLNFLMWLLTTPGLIIFSLFNIYALVYNIARCVTYPGFLANVKRTLEQDIASEVRRSTISELFKFSEAVSFIAQLWTSTPRQLSVWGHSRILSRLGTHERSLEVARSICIESLVDALSERLEELEGDESTTTKDMIVCAQQLFTTLQSLLVVDEYFRNSVLAPIRQVLESRNSVAGVELVLQPVFKSLPYDATLLVDARVLKERPLPSPLLCAIAADKDFYPDRDKLVARLAAEPGKALEYMVYLSTRAADLALFLDEQPQDSGIAASRESVADEDGEGIELTQVSLEMKEDDTVDLEQCSGADNQQQGGIWAYACNFVNNYHQARLPMRAIATIDFMRVDLAQRFNGQQHWVTMGDRTKIDGMLLPGLTLGSAFPDRRTMLVCNPNCGIYEFAAYQCQWAQFYTQRGINVFLYNYRGYGRSQGWPSPDKLRSDGETIVRFLVSDIGVQHGWLGVHAESIGGVVACHLAAKAEELGITYMVADRTFCDLPMVATTMLGAWAGKIMYRIGWPVNNSYGFISAPHSLHRLCTCDPADTIIANTASLKAGIARQLVKIACETHFQGQPAAASSDGDVDIEMAPIGNNTKSKHSLSVVETARAHVGPTSNIASWAHDLFFFDKFACACVRLCGLQQRMADAPHWIGRLPLACEEIQELVKMIWFADGMCGQVLGQPLAEFYSYWKILNLKSEGTEESLLPPMGTTANEAKATERVKPLMDWAHCLIVWGCTTPPAASLIDSNANTQNEASTISTFNLEGEIGYCSPRVPIPFGTTLRAIKAFQTNRAVPIDAAGLTETVDTVVNGLETIYEAHRRVKEQNQTTMKLLPLTCGHNGRMNDKEEAIVVKHLESAGWVNL